jgi:hypothetical protein
LLEHVLPGGGECGKSVEEFLYIILKLTRRRKARTWEDPHPKTAFCCSEGGGHINPGNGIHGSGDGARDEAELLGVRKQLLKRGGL